MRIELARTCEALPGRCGVAETHLGEASGGEGDRVVDPMLVAKNQAGVVISAGGFRVILQRRGARRLVRSDVSERSQFRQVFLARAIARRGGRRGGALKILSVVD